MSTLIIWWWQWWWWWITCINSCDTSPKVDPEAEEETSCHWAHHLVREVLKESVHDTWGWRLLQEAETRRGRGRYRLWRWLLLRQVHTPADDDDGWTVEDIMILIMARKLKLMTKLWFIVTWEISHGRIRARQRVMMPEMRKCLVGVTVNYIWFDSNNDHIFMTM